MKHLFGLMIAVLLGASVHGQDARISLASDDETLVKGFSWAKKQAGVWEP